MKKKLYFDFVQEIVKGHDAKSTEKEKAMLDMLYLGSSAYAVSSLMFEELQIEEDEFGFGSSKPTARAICWA